MRRVMVFDTTLRDGLKSPGTFLSIEEKVRVAKRLAGLGVDILEIGFPAASEEQYEAVRRIAAEVEGPVVAVLARATNARDFEVAWNAVKSARQPRLHTFVPVSEQYREHFLRRAAGPPVDLAISAVEMARQYFSDVEFTLVDAFRADPDEVVQLALAAIEAGAGVINLADTVGCATPKDVARVFDCLSRKVYRFEEMRFSIHCHNDLGLALANSIAAIAAGASQVHCTVNGIGERAGNTALEELAAVLDVRGASMGAETGLRLERIYPISRLVRRLTGIGVQPHKPVVGDRAFAWEAGIPQLEDTSGKPPFEIMEPARFGIGAGLAGLTAESGPEEFQQRVAELGFELEGDRFEECFAAFRELAARKEQVFDADIELLVSAGGGAEPVRYRLTYLNVGAGTISVPNATVQLEVDGELRQDAGFGHGPVDAAFRTICRIVRHCPKLVRYEIESVTPGADALGEVTLQLEEDGHVANGRAVDTDIVLASARAFVDALNRLDAVGAGAAVSEYTDKEGWMPRL